MGEVAFEFRVKHFLLRCQARVLDMHHGSLLGFGDHRAGSSFIVNTSSLHRLHRVGLFLVKVEAIDGCKCNDGSRDFLV